MKYCENKLRLSLSFFQYLHLFLLYFNVKDLQNKLFHPYKILFGTVCGTVVACSHDVIFLIPL